MSSDEKEEIFLSSPQEKNDSLESEIFLEKPPFQEESLEESEEESLLPEKAKDLSLPSKINDDEINGLVQFGSTDDEQTIHYTVKSDLGVVIAEFSLIDVESPSLAERVCEINSARKSFLVGRATHCDYQIHHKSKYVAEEQALIIYSMEDESYIVRCLTRENPIAVNEENVVDELFLKNGDVIRLGAAKNAPNLRFVLSEEKIGEKTSRRVQKLSSFLPSLVRGKEYLVGGDKTDIDLEMGLGNEVTLTLKVPNEGKQILICKSEKSSVPVFLEESEVQAKESRAWSPEQRLQIGNLTLVNDHSDFSQARQMKKCVFSDFVATPERGSIYTIGNDENATFSILDDALPPLIAEISVPTIGEYCQVKKTSNCKVDIFVDKTLVSDYMREGIPYGVNQVIQVGDYLEIRNNHRFLPPARSSYAWKTYIMGFSVCILLASMILGVIWASQKYSGKIQNFFSSQNLMKAYQKNVFYIAVFDSEMNSSSSGTGFIVAEKDAYDRDIYYIVTCKHVIEPWKYEKHYIKDDKFFNDKDVEISPYRIAIWPFGSNAIDQNDRRFILRNSFTNLPSKDKLGELVVYKTGKDIFKELGKEGDKVFQKHTDRSNEDLAVIRLIPNEKDWKYEYTPWKIVERDKIEVGESIITLGYSLGTGRLLNKNGRAIPAACEGRLTSECEVPDFLELDVNQNQGSSGGPIVNKNGEIVGIVSFTDQDKKLLYGIHGKILDRLMR